MCKVLMDAGADPNALNDEGNTAVLEACKNGSVALVDSVSLGANWSVQANTIGMRLGPLHIAAAAGNLPLVSFLLKKRAPGNLII